MKVQLLLNEITKPDLLRDAVKYLQDRGYDLLGYGSFGVILRKNTDPWVLKLFTNDDSAYIAFVKYAVENPSVHFPRFKGNFIRINDRYSAIRMELLHPSPDNNPHITELMEYSRAINMYYKHFDDFRNRYKSNKWRDAGFGSLYDEQIFKEKIDIVNEFREFYPEEAKIVDELIKTFVWTHKFSLDFKGNNFMYRGTKIVFTDPLKNGF